MCNSVDDIPMLLNEHEETLITPAALDDCLTQEELTRLQNIDFLRHSQVMAYDVFVEAIQCIT